MSITDKSKYYKNKYRTFVIRLDREHDQDYIRMLEDEINVTNFIRMLLYLYKDGDK